LAAQGVRKLLRLVLNVRLPGYVSGVGFCERWAMTQREVETLDMTHRERFVRVLTGQPVERVPFIKVFGGDNAVVAGWEQDRPGISKCIDEVLQFEGGFRGWQTTRVNVDLTLTAPAEIIEEDDEKVIRRTQDGTVRLARKGGDYHGRILEWAVKDRADWERVRDRHLQADDPARFPEDWAEYVALCRERDFALQLSHRGVYGFIRTLVGDENLAYAFYDDPGLVHEIMDTYTDMAIAVWTKMVAEIDFDLIECWEDMASRNGAFISPDMFREFMKPNYEKIAEFARAHGIPIVLVDSDGYIESLADVMKEAGVTAMYPFEVQAGNDVAAFMDRDPDFGVIGGLDKNVMARGREAIDREIEKARMLIRKGRFIPGPDHFVLSDVPWDGYRYFMERLREVVMTTRPGA